MAASLLLSAGCWLTSLPAHGLIELNGIAKIAAGSAHTCALTTAGGVKCWGSNTYGQLGDNSTLQRLTPVDVSGLGSGVAAITAAAFHTCALTTAGGVKCWGAGWLGNISLDRSLTPVDVSDLGSGVAAISAGREHTCALTTAGSVKCWGQNDNGQLGDNSTTQRRTPVDVLGLGSGSAVAITVGATHTCALTTAGGAKCWGYNTAGELGDNSRTQRLTPVDVSGLGSGVAAIAAGQNRTFALTTAGGVKCWGWNTTFGYLGDGTSNGQMTPVDVFGLGSGVTAVTAGGGNGNHTCALTTAGGVKCWGNNESGQVGDGSDSRGWWSIPVDVAGLTSGAAAITVGKDHTCVLTTAGGVKCWGNNSNSQLGDGTTQSRRYPAAVLMESVMSANPTSLNFGGQSMGTASPALTVTVTNSGTGAFTINGVSLSTAQFSQTNNCTTVAPSASCTITVTFTPAPTTGALNSTVAVPDALTITSNAPGSPHTVSLAGSAEKSLTRHYYRAILNRAPEAGGKEFWDGEAARLSALGANVNETWFVMAGYFFNSTEYLAANKTNTQFVNDLYNTFFNRPADGSGSGYWSNQIVSGMPREVVLFSFMFSPEFATFTQGIFGNTAARPEVNVVMDFFRGILNRLPDSAAYGYWVNQLRIAQCAGAGAVYAKVNEISASFIFNPEYNNRARNNTQYVTDMYYSFLRRGGDTTGVGFWVNQLNTGGKDRNTVRTDFVSSPEFGARVQSVIAAGCVP